MKSRAATWVAAGWIGLAAAATLSAPGRLQAGIRLFPWLGYDRISPFLGQGTHIAIARAAFLAAGAALLAIALLATGSAVRRWLGFRGTDPASRAAVSVLLGFGAWGAAFLGLGLAGVFMASILVVAAAMMAATGRSVGLPRLAVPRLPSVVMLAALAYLALQFAPYWFCPETDQDALHYHLALPERFLRLHRVVLDPLVASTYAFRPTPVELVYALPVAAGLDATARLLHALGLLVGLMLVFGFVDRRAGRAAAWLACGFWLAPLSVANIAARAKTDLIADAAAAGVWLVWLEGPRSRGRLLAAAALAGCAVATKLTTAAVVVPWACAAGFMTLRRRRWGMAAAAAGMAALPVVPWLIRTWLVTGDPVYPHLSPRWFAGLAWHEGNRELLSGVYRYMSFRGPSAAVTGLLRLDVPFLLALAPAALVLRGWPAIAAACMAAAYAGLLAAQPAAHYTIPAVWVATACLVPALASLPVPAARLLRGAALLLAIVPAVFRFPAAETMADDRARWGNPWPYLLGGESAETFLTARLTTYRAMAKALPGLVEPGRSVLLHQDTRSYGLPVPALRGQEDVDDPVLRRLARESGTVADLGKKLRQLDVGALAINPVIAYRYLAEVHPLAWDDRALGVYRDFVARRVTGIWSSPTEDDLSGAYTVIGLGTRDHAPRPVPLLPGTEPVWARASYRMMTGGGGPDPRVEAELVAIAARLPGVGEAQSKLGNYRFVTGARAKAAESYRLALADGYVDGILLARLVYCLPLGRERDEAILRLRARCGPGAYALLDSAARWVK